MTAARPTPTPTAAATRAAAHEVKLDSSTIGVRARPASLAPQGEAAGANDYIPDNLLGRRPAHRLGRGRQDRARPPRAPDLLATSTAWTCDASASSTATPRTPRTYWTTRPPRTIEIVTGYAGPMRHTLTPHPPPAVRQRGLRSHSPGGHPHPLRLPRSALRRTSRVSEVAFFAKQR
jgi:hypothetical protein